MPTRGMPCALLVFAAAMLVARPVIASPFTLTLGFVAFDTFIPGDGAPGVESALDVFNTSDLPLDDGTPGPASTFTALGVTLFDVDGVPVEIAPGITRLALGDLGPGPLLDAQGNPLLQFADSSTFTAVELFGSVAPFSLSLTTGLFVLDRITTFDIVLRPTAGNTSLLPGDFAAIDVTGDLRTVPEASSVTLCAIGILATACYRRRRRPVRVA